MAIQVPRYDQPEVARQIRPGARSEASAPIEAFGGGAATTAAFKAAGDLAKVGGEIFQAEKDQADISAAQKAHDETIRIRNRIMYGSGDGKDPGAIARKGKDAFGSLAESMPAFDKEIDKIEEGLGSDRQRAMFSRLRSKERTNLETSLREHISKEAVDFQDSTEKSLGETYTIDAVTNFQTPGRVDENIKNISGLVESRGVRMGWDRPQIDQEKANAVATVHAGVVRRILANGDDATASAYFKANKDSFGKYAADLAHDLEEGSSRGESLRQSDSIWGASKGDLQKALTSARDTIKDAKIQDLTVARLKQRASDEEAAKKLGQEQAYVKVTGLLDNRSGVAARLKIPPSMWNAMSPEQQAAAERRAGDPPNNDSVWLDFLGKDAKAVGSMSRAEFETNYWSHFDKEHRAKAENQWNLARDAKSNPAKAAQFHSIKSDKEMVLDALKGTGISGFSSKDTFSTLQKDADKSALYKESENAADLAFQNHFTRTGKEPTDIEKMQIVGDILKKKVFVKKYGAFGIDSFARDAQKPVGLINPEDKATAYVPIDSIDKGDKTVIQNILRSKGKTVTSDKVERAYAAYLLKDFALYQKILGEK